MLPAVPADKRASAADDLLALTITLQRRQLLAELVRGHCGQNTAATVDATQARHQEPAEHNTGIPAKAELH